MNEPPIVHKGGLKLILPVPMAPKRPRSSSSLLPLQALDMNVSKGAAAGFKDMPFKPVTGDWTPDLSSSSGYAFVQTQKKARTDYPYHFDINRPKHEEKAFLIWAAIKLGLYNVVANDKTHQKRVLEFICDAFNHFTGAKLGNRMTVKAVKDALNSWMLTEGGASRQLLKLYAKTEEALKVSKYITCFTHQKYETEPLTKLLVAHVRVYFHKKNGALDGDTKNAIDFTGKMLLSYMDELPLFASETSILQPPQNYFPGQTREATEYDGNQPPAIGWDGASPITLILHNKIQTNILPILQTIQDTGFMKKGLDIEIKHKILCGICESYDPEFYIQNENSFEIKLTPLILQHHIQAWLLYFGGASPKDFFITTQRAETLVLMYADALLHPFMKEDSNKTMDAVKKIAEELVSELRSLNVQKEEEQGMRDEPQVVIVKTEIDELSDLSIEDEKDQTSNDITNEMTEEVTKSPAQIINEGMALKEEIQKKYEARKRKMAELAQRSIVSKEDDVLPDDFNESHYIMIPDELPLEATSPEASPRRPPDDIVVEKVIPSTPTRKAAESLAGESTKTNAGSSPPNVNHELYDIYDSDVFSAEELLTNHIDHASNSDDLHCTISASSTPINTALSVASKKMQLSSGIPSAESCSPMRDGRGTVSLIPISPAEEDGPVMVDAFTQTEGIPETTGAESMMESINRLMFMIEGHKMQTNMFYAKFCGEISALWAVTERLKEDREDH